MKLQEEFFDLSTISPLDSVKKHRYSYIRQGKTLYIVQVMLCPVDQKSETQVIETRSDGRVVRRRRVCLKCGFRFTTHEIIEMPKLLVIKKDGKKEPFCREKITLGIKKACEKRPICTRNVEKMADKIVAQVYEHDKKEIETKKIGQWVMEELKNADLVAYLRFASVYRSFKSPKSFETEIQKISKKPKANI